MLPVYHPKLTERIIEQTPRTILGLILISSIFIWIHKDFIPFKLFSIWITAQVLFILLRAINAKKLAQSIKTNDTNKTRTHTYVLLLLIIYSAFLWSTSTILALFYAPMHYEFISLLMIIGLVTAGSLTLSPFFHVYMVYFFILTFTQLYIMFFLGNTIHIALALMLMIFIPMIFLFSKSIYLNTLHAIKINESLEKSVIKLHELSITDTLTDTYNRRYFFIEGKKLLSISQRGQQDITLLMIDLDKFKNINDTYGHQAGDNILIAFSTEIKNMIRESDIFARVGGEEFALLLNNTSSAPAKKIAEKLCSSIQNKKFTHNDININVTICIGIATLNINTVSLDTLYHEADQNLYKAKKLGRNQSCG